MPEIEIHRVLRMTPPSAAAGDHRAVQVLHERRLPPAAPRGWPAAWNTLRRSVSNPRPPRSRNPSPVCAQSACLGLSGTVSTRRCRRPTTNGRTVVATYFIVHPAPAPRAASAAAAAARQCHSARLLLLSYVVLFREPFMNLLPQSPWIC
jgi:hypothetical protein